MREAALSEMLAAFLSRKLLGVIRSTFSGSLHERSEGIDNIWLLSTQAFGAMQKGEVFFTVQSWQNHPDTTRLQTVSYHSFTPGGIHVDVNLPKYNVDTNNFKPQLDACLSLPTDTMHLENRTPELTPIPNEELLGIHARFSKSLAWMDTGEYMDTSHDAAIGKDQDYYLQLVFNGVYR